MLQQIIFERGEPASERTGIAEWPQPHVDSEDESVRGRRREQAQQHLPETDVELVMTDGSRMLSLAVFRKEEDEIDIGGEFQLSPPELTHTDDDERHRSPIFVEWRSVTRDHRLHRIVDGELHCIIGKRRKIGERFFECGEPREVAPSDPHHLAATPETQPALRGCFICTQRECDPLRPTRSAACQTRGP